MLLNVEPNRQFLRLLEIDLNVFIVHVTESDWNGPWIAHLHKIPITHTIFSVSTHISEQNRFALNVPQERDVQKISHHCKDHRIIVVHE